LQPADPLPGQACKWVDAHCQDLGIDLDRMGALLHAERQEGVRADRTAVQAGHRERG
jgi:hypothetical protein